MYKIMLQKMSLPKNGTSPNTGTGTRAVTVILSIAVIIDWSRKVSRIYGHICTRESTGPQQNHFSHHPIR